MKKEFGEVDPKTDKLLFVPDFSITSPEPDEDGGTRFVVRVRKSYLYELMDTIGIKEMEDKLLVEKWASSSDRQCDIDDWFGEEMKQKDVERIAKEIANLDTAIRKKMMYLLNKVKHERLATVDALLAWLAIKRGVGSGQWNFRVELFD